MDQRKTKFMSWSDFHRLRKYKRKKERDLDRWGVLYWRYHYKVYGPILDIWELDNV